MTFTVPVPQQDPTGDAVIAKFPQVVDKKIPMRCQFRPEINSWECDVATFWERRSVWWAIGTGVGGFLLGAVIGRATK